MLTRNEKFILSAWSYISSQQENTLSSISGQHCVWKPCFMNSRNSNVQIICESLDYTTENMGPGVRPLTENPETGVNISIVIVLQREVWFNVSRDPERR